MVGATELNGMLHLPTTRCHVDYPESEKRKCSHETSRKHLRLVYIRVRLAYLCACACMHVRGHSLLRMRTHKLSTYVYVSGIYERYGGVRAAKNLS
jgi:hypothetical protein